MTRISTISAEKADGIVKEGYDMFLNNIGMIPRPMEMLSVSPVLFESQMIRLKYNARHPRLSFSLLAHIRYLAARSLSYPFCTDFNRMVLKKLGLGEEDLEKLEADPSQSLLEEKENAMLIFVITAMKAPSKVTSSDIDALRELGWTDRDMVEALAQGVSMIDHAIMMEVFDMNQACIVPATEPKASS